MTHLRVQVAEWAVAQGDTLITTLGLGSCVAIAIHDPLTRIGGLAHILLPERTVARPSSNPAKFAETAVPLLIAEMQRLGAAPSHRLQARLAGGASMFAALLQMGGLNVGERNVIASRAALERAGVSVVGEDIGGDYGRSVYFHLRDGRCEVRSLKRGTNVI
jgi:chemotaxis protein CheD